MGGGGPSRGVGAVAAGMWLRAGIRSPVSRHQREDIVDRLAPVTGQENIVIQVRSDEEIIMKKRERESA